MELVLGTCPCESTDPRLVEALCRAGALGVLDLGADLRAGEAALASLVSRRVARFGVRISDCAWLGRALPEGARVVILATGRASSANGNLAKAFGDRFVMIEAVCIEEAREAVAAGAHGIVAKGNESAGRVGDEPAFVLSQRLLREISIPIWVAGGIGVHSAAACIAGGARGVLLESQLALFAESSLDAETKRAISSIDGTETRVVCGRRVFARPGKIAEDRDRDTFAVGQDAALARPLAETYGTVRALVRAIERSARGHLLQARALAPMAENAPLAHAHGLRYPIAQGPMTRVSDRAAFADAVSRAGGLPFLALSLSRGKEARALLEETRTLLGDRPWGVGILGFVPPELRDEQLAIVKDVKPPIALIAGGRPAQARPLEDHGIATYLHVPSMGLLDMFLKDGARRFVFEGRECGGHVGPRSSFILWESAIERLLREEDAREISVLFAGGVHDARSAAMVSVMAAPLAAKGAKIGVLMGTAYLFTEEAVATGAIGPAFQDEALACDRTVLLETAPGHATRCADTSYAKLFDVERARLESKGAGPQETWEALEQLNLGRLRVASKGVERKGEELQHVDVGTQHREGMFMIGQVAALRNARVTIAELHDEVSRGAVEMIANAQPVEVEAPRAAPMDIAIVGMACVLPDAPDLATFWNHVVAGHDAVREVPHSRWNADLYYDPKGAGEKTPSKWGGFIPEIAFEPAVFGIPPRALAAIDPVQLLSLEVARRAIDDAGYATRPFDRERTSVVFGAEAGADLASAYGFRAQYTQFLGKIPEDLDRALPKLTEDSFAGVLSNVISGRIANRLDLGGANYTVDAACASALAAVDLACKELVAGTSDMVVCGGADLHNSIGDYLLFASVHALSPTGKCRTFDANADGIALGEGVAAVVLKRLRDAERDGDRVYAVIKGTGAASDGKSLGLTAPRKEGQKRALDRAYERAGLSPASVGLIEAHGTGTVVGDRTELATLTEVFGESGALPSRCTLGSVKSHIGHTKCCAGLAGLVKAALAIHHGVLPPTGNLETASPAYDPETSPFAFRAQAEPWIEDTRCAGVSAFGFGGTNYHIVLASSGDRKGTSDAWSAESLIHGADEHEALATLDVLDTAAASGHATLRDLAKSACARGQEKPVYVAIVAKNTEDLRHKIKKARERDRRVDGVILRDEARVFRADETAMLFSGQGSQRPGMLADLFALFPEARDALALGPHLVDKIFPPRAFTTEGRAEQKARLTDTRVAQPALGVCDLAVAKVLARFGVSPRMLAGHSYGELVALTVAGCIPETSLVALSEARAHAILEAASGAPGTMAAVSAPVEKVKAVLLGVSDVVVANENAPDQVVIAGSEDAVARACAKLGEEKISARPIAVACAFHSPIVAGGAALFARALEDVTISPPSRVVFANTDAAPYPREARAIQAKLARQIAEPVRFAAEIEAMYEAGARVFIEAGPGSVLSDLVARILKGRPHVAISSEGAERGLAGFLALLGKLAVCGVPFEAAALFDSRDARAFDLAKPPAGPSANAWMIDGHRARPLRGELPDFAMRFPEEPIAIAPVAAQPVGDEQVMLQYIESMREMVEGQRQVMMRYLGDASPSRRVLDAHATIVNEPATTKTLPPPPAESDPTIPGRSAIAPIEALVAAVSERTGYPADMLDLDLDLEADLGIDSIKRIEILGMMAERLDIKELAGAARSEVIEAVAPMKTLRKMGAWFEARLGLGPKSAVAAPAVESKSPEKMPETKRTDLEPQKAKSDVGRYVLEVSALPPAVRNGVRVEGKLFAIRPDKRGVALALATLLEANGAKVRVLSEQATLADHGSVDGLVHLEALGARDANEKDHHGAVRSLFVLAQEAQAMKSHWVIGASGLGGAFGVTGHASPESSGSPLGGVSGLLKSVAKELPGTRVRAIDLSPDEDPQALAKHLYDEMLADDAHVEVGYARGVRQSLRAVSRPMNGASPRTLIDRDAVVLVTGGARGITAEIAVEMAQKYACRLELVGRTPLGDDEEDAETRAATDAMSLRKVLLARAHGGGVATPAAIEAVCKRMLAARDIRKTIARIERAGGRATYHAVDVRDAAAFGALIDRIRATHGRIDGAIHGAGVTEDKLLRDKTRESFDRVLETKIVSARVLAEKLTDAKFIAFFSSVSGVFGNRGQVDYAAANDALDKLAHHLRRRGVHVVSIGWGPWSGVGMVSPELEREYVRRGVGLVSIETGAAMFVDELCRGAEAQVILSAASPESLA